MKSLSSTCLFAVALPFLASAARIEMVENARVKVGVDLDAGGAIMHVEDKLLKTGNMINSFDRGRQIQQSYYSGPVPFIGPNGEQPDKNWAQLGWNPIQTGDCGGNASPVLAFERPSATAMKIVTSPMLWPHSGVRAECTFETLIDLRENGFAYTATIRMARSDKTDYGLRPQEIPAVYTNARWYKLVSYTGDRPWTGAPTAVLVGKDDRKGWPWLHYTSPELWSALLDDADTGLGVYCGTAQSFTAGFFGGDAAKGRPLTAKDSPTGYIAPLTRVNLRHDTVYSYTSHFAVGSLAEIRKTFAALAAETRNLKKPQVWSRDGKAALKPLDDGGSFELRHTGRRDWAVGGIPRIEVQAGDVFRFSCSSAALADVPESNDYTLSVVLRDAKGDVLAWTYASHGAKPGRPIDFSFMVPPGGATIEPRLVGTGICGVAVRDVQIVRTRRGTFETTADQSVETEALRVTVSGRTGALTVTDRRTHRTWAPEGANGGFVVSSIAMEAQTIRARLVDPESMRAFTATFAVAADRPEVLVSLAGEGEMTSSFAFPAAFATKPGDRLVVPMNEGISFPADDAADLPDRLIAYGGHGICMAFFGVQEDATGAGWMGLIETPDDAGMLKVAREGSPMAALGPYWDDQKKQFGYTRKFRYVFFDKGGYVAMCKRYRAYAKDVGKFKSFAEKVKERPEIDRLLGAPNIWCWERDKIAVAKQLAAAGIDRYLWSADGSPEEVKYLASLPNVLVSRYDVYQDIYHPDQLKQLGWKSGSNTEAWPHDVVWNSADSNDWRHAWGVKAKDGSWTWCAMMCDKVAPAYERRNVKADLVNKPFNTRFIDTTVAAPWQTCWNPAHPMTRGDSREAKMELLRLLGDEFKLVVGSETGHDASVPYCDYYEGMLSLGPYRVPDSGRHIREIWTNVPPRVAKYQLGEKYRLPLWELVYHECVCAHWYWGDYNNKLPALWSKRDLFNVLYGTMGMYMFNNKQWAEDKDRFVRSYKTTSPVARATGYSEMLEHKILTADRTVQQTRFANGMVVTVNFGRKPYACADGTVLAPESHRIENR